jgi:hypothetical protein
MSVHLMVKWTFHELLALALYIVWSVSRHVEFDFWEKEEVTLTWMRCIWGLWNHWNILFCQKFVHGDGRVTEHCRGAASKMFCSGMYTEENLDIR